MKYRVTLFCLGVTFYAFTAMAMSIIKTNIAYTKDVQLPKKEALALEKIVCVKPYQLRAYTIQGYKDVESKAAFDSAFVQCQAHGEFRGKPMYYQAGCSFSNNAWQCNQAGLEIAVSINGRDVKMHPWGMSPEAAYQILAKISTYGTFQSITMDEAIGSSCYISPSKDKDMVELNCQSTITVSSWCPQPQLTNCPRVVYVSPRLL